MEKKQLTTKISGIRIDSFLQQHVDISRVVAKKWIKNQCVFVNNTLVTKASYSLTKGDRIHYLIEKQPSPPPQDHHILTIDYLYEDNDILIINKPPGLVVHLGVDTTETTLVNELIKDKVVLYNYGDKNRSGIVHRLDRMTEGLMVLAKTKLAYESLTQQFKNRQIKKHYYALLKGNLTQNTIVNQPIDRHPKHRHKYYVSQNGREACTKFFIKKNFNSTTLCSIELITGRTHQIRVHSHFLGYPVIGDAVYTKTSRKSGQLLQAYSLGLTHPKNNTHLLFTLPLSERIQTSI
tara:strand:- start:1078 stop:1956 length:879 start_codon:yes stop_codon:yes gene_type:complete